MEPLRHSIATREGEVWLWHRAGALASDKPVVLWIEGAFAIPRTRGFQLEDFLPEAAVFNAHLPGNHAPSPRNHSVEAYAAAYTEALDQLGRPAIVVGSSVGALAAFAIASPWVKGLVALEPPLLTAKLWPLIEPFQQLLRDRADDADIRGLIGSVFGYGPDSAEGRDYRPLLDGLAVPTWALFGGEPLHPERAFERVPSLVDEPERALLAAHPMIGVRRVDGVGHNVGGRAITYVRTCVRDLIVRTIGTDQTQAEVN